MSADVGEMRHDYEPEPLRRDEVAEDPADQFEAWFEEAERLSRRDLPNAGTLSTSTAEGRPSARMVLLKEFGPEGFVIYSNYRSRKGREIAENPRVALTLWWPILERQVRIGGPVEKVGPERSDAYFARRPRASQLSAWASAQSSAVAGREELEDRMEAARSRFDGQSVPRPDHWGGYRIEPVEIEFWQGQPHRLHDRIRYRRAEVGADWVIERLAP